MSETPELAAPSLRGVLHGAIALLVGLAAMMAIALSTVTTLLDRTTAGAGAAVESIRLTQALQSEITTLHRAAVLSLLGAEPSASVLAGSRDARIHRLVEETRRFASSDGERDLVERADEAITAYLATVRAPPPGDARAALAQRFDATMTALDAVAWHNVDDARALVVRSEQWSRLADFIGLAAGALTVILAGALLLLFRRSVFAALASLHGAVCRFVDGDRDARALERGAREVRDLARSFNAMADRISREEHDRLSFLTGLAQDLRDPLTVIKLLGRSSADANAASGVDRQVRRMERILRDIVDGALIASGKLDLRLEHCDATRLARDVVDAYRAEVPDHPITFITSEPEIDACVDAKRVEHVLVNLLSNAAKFSPAGSPIAVSLGATRELVTITVTDHGVGIAPAEIPRIFAPYRRTGASSGHVSGVGLGLAAAKRIVEAHGGAIEVESSCAGSTFRVTLPRDQPSVAARGEQRGERDDQREPEEKQIAHDVWRKA